MIGGCIPSSMGNGVSQGPQKLSPWQTEAHAEHEGSINCMALSENGNILATGSDDNTVRLWTTTTSLCQCLGVLRGHDKYITCLAMEGAYVLSGSADRTVKKWDTSTGQCVFTYEGHTGMINRLICTGDFVISSSYDTTARCWLLEPMKGTDPCLRIFRGHQKGVYPLVFIPAADELKEEDPDIEDVLITGSGDNTARAWSLETGRCVKIFRGHTGPVHSLATDTSGRLLFTGSADGTIRSWDVIRGDLIKVLEGHEQAITALLVVNKFLFSASADRSAKSWVIEFGDCARTFKGHKHSVSCITYHDGIVYTGSGDGLIRAFEAKSGVLRRVFKGHQYTVNCFKIVNDRLFTGSFDHSLRIWSLANIRDATDPFKIKKPKDPSPTGKNSNRVGASDLGKANYGNYDRNP